MSGPLGAAEARRYLAAVLAAFFVAAGLFNVLHPIWEAPDEPQHYEYVRYLSEYRALPHSIEFGLDKGGLSESHQMPLYYVLQAVTIGWVGDDAQTIWHPNPFVTWRGNPARLAIATHRQEELFPYRGYVLGVHLARLLSSLMGAGTILVTYLIACHLLPDRRLAVGAAALVAFTPGFVFTSATVNNDNGVILASALALLHGVWLLGKREPSWRDGVVGGGLLGVAVLMKASGLLLVVVVIVVWAAILRRGGVQRLRHGLVALVPLPVAFLLLTAWWPILMRQELGRIAGNLALGVTVDTLLPTTAGLSRGQIARALSVMFRSYWGQFGWVGELILPDWVGAALAVICVASLAGLVVFTTNRGWRRYGQTAPLGLLVLTLFAVTSVYALVTRWMHSPIAGVDNGRFIYPAIPAIGILLALGLANLTRRPATMLGAVTLALLALTLAVPFVVSRQSFPPPVPTWAVFDEATVQQRLDIGYANGVTLLGLNVTAPNSQHGGVLGLELFWRADADRKKDFWATVRLVNAAGETVASSHAPPQRDAYPPSLWLHGEVTPDPRALALPSQAPPGVYTLELRLTEDDANSVDVPREETGANDSLWMKLCDVRI